jgi:hypothetical protein
LSRKGKYPRWDPDLLGELLAQFEAWRGTPLTPTETEVLESIRAKYEYQIVFDAMPIRRGVE